MRCLQAGTLVALLAGPGTLLGATDEVEGQGVRDSAGVRVVSYARGARAPQRWRVDPRPIVTIGGAGGAGPTEFANVVFVARLGDDRVAVVNATSNEIRWFTPQGAFDRASGRKGRGPGEFDTIIDATRRGDSIAVTDRAFRLQVVGPDGSMLRGYQAPQFEGRSPFGWSGVFADGRGVLRALDPPSDTTSMQLTATMSFGARAADGGRVTFLMQLPVYELRRTARMMTPLYLGPSMRASVLPRRFCGGSGATWEVRCVSPEGPTLSITRRVAERTSPSEAEKEAFRAVWGGMMRNAPPAQKAAALASLEFASHTGVFGRMFAAGDDLWVGEFATAEDLTKRQDGWMAPDRPTTWSVLGPDGRWVADVELPPRFTPTDASRTWVAGTRRDADDVEQVVIFRLVPR